MTDRTKTVGGSDVAAIVGLSPWKTPAGVWLEKTGRLQDDRDSSAMEWGRRLEAAVVERYMDDHPDMYAETGLDALPCDCGTAWHSASPDALIVPVGATAPARGLEVKTTSQWNGDQWDDGVPVHYQVQCQWYMHATGLKRWDVAVLIGGSDYRTYTLTRDSVAIVKLVSAVDTFWEAHVEADVQPAITGPDMSFRFIAPNPDETKQVDADAVEAARAYREAANVEKEARAAKEQAADRLRGLLGTAIEATYEGRTVATWKPVTQHRFDVARFKAEHPDLHGQYTTEAVSRRLHIPKEDTP